MWYFTWIIGVGCAVLLAVVAAMWLEIQDDAKR
jgi:cyd operon protein YbgT